MPREIKNEVVSFGKFKIWQLSKFQRASLRPYLRTASAFIDKYAVFKRVRGLELHVFQFSV